MKRKVEFPQTCTHTWKDSHHEYTQHPYPPTHPRLHQDDSRPLSLRDKDSVSWDDVTAAFLMGVNLCLAEQQQKNLCVALNPHVLPRTRAASVLFCSSMWLSLLTFSPLPFFPPSFKAPLLLFSPYFNCLYFTLAVSITHFLHIFLLSEVCFFLFSFSVFFLSFPSLNICSSVSFLSLYFFKTLTVPYISFFPSFLLFWSSLFHPPPSLTNESFKLWVFRLNCWPTVSAKGLIHWAQVIERFYKSGVHDVGEG